MTKLLPCDLWVMTYEKIHHPWGCFTFSFCEELWPKQNYKQFIWGFWRHVFKMAFWAATCMPSSNLGAKEVEIWTSSPHISTKGGLL